MSATDLEVFRVLLEHGTACGFTNPNLRDKRGQTPLHNVLHMNIKTLEIVKLLLKHKADASIVDYKGRSLLHHSVRFDDEPCATFFLQKGFDINAPDHQGNTPLHLIMKSNEGVCLQLLFDHKVEVNVINKKGETPLHLASKNGLITWVYLLLEHGANDNIKNKEGLTASQMPEISMIFGQLLQDYSNKNSDTGVSYLFFSNFLMYLTNIYGLVKWTEPFFRALITDCLSKYFKSLDRDFELRIIDEWYDELYG